jgi:hypothetical protein
VALAPVLRRRRLRWYVFGAQALIAHGRPRLTDDVDVTVEVDPARLRGLIAAMGRAGFAPRVTDLDVFIARARVIPFLHVPSEAPLDMVLASTGLEHDFATRAVRADLGGVRVPVIAPGDLIVTKVISGRTKDLDDIAGILATQGPTLDTRRIRTLLGELDAALGDTEFVARFDRLARTQGSPR